MDHSKFHAYVELVEKRVEKAEVANRVAKGITGSQAFRSYAWLQRVPHRLAWNLYGPATNTAGNFRGMVLSKSWKSAFAFTVNAGEVLEKIGGFAAVAAAIAHSYEKIDRVVSSKEGWDQKGAKLGAHLTAIAMHVLTGTVTGPAHLLLTSMPMEGYCGAVDLARGFPVGTWTETLKSIDTVISAAADQVTDGDEIYSWINVSINPRVSRMLGF